MAISLRTGSTFLFLSHSPPAQYKAPTQSPGGGQPSPNGKKCFATDLTFPGRFKVCASAAGRILLFTSTYRFGLGTGHEWGGGNSYMKFETLGWSTAAMGLNLSSTSYPLVLSELFLLSTLIHWSSQWVSKYLLGTYYMPGTELGRVGDR